MKLRQISLFLENRPGTLTVPCRLLAQAGVNIVTFSLADTQQFGIMRMIVDDVDKAKQALEAGGCVVKLTEVVAIEVPDRPGGLEHILEVVEQAGVNVEYMYAFTIRHDGNGVLVFRFNEPDKAIAHLQKAGVKIVDAPELQRRINR